VCVCVCVCVCVRVCVCLCVRVCVCVCQEWVCFKSPAAAQLMVHTSCLGSAPTYAGGCCVVGVCACVPKVCMSVCFVFGWIESIIGGSMKT